MLHLRLPQSPPRGSLRRQRRHVTTPRGAKVLICERKRLRPGGIRVSQSPDSSVELRPLSPHGARKGIAVSGAGTEGASARSFLSRIRRGRAFGRPSEAQELRLLGPTVHTRCRMEHVLDATASITLRCSRSRGKVEMRPPTCAPAASLPPAAKASPDSIVAFGHGRCGDWGRGARRSGARAMVVKYYGEGDVTVSAPPEIPGTSPLGGPKRPGGPAWSRGRVTPDVREFVWVDAPRRSAPTSASCRTRGTKVHTREQRRGAAGHLARWRPGRDRRSRGRRPRATVLGDTLADH